MKAKSHGWIWLVLASVAIASIVVKMHKLAGARYGDWLGFAAPLGLLILATGNWHRVRHRERHHG